jgi:hypothetical protein
VLVLADAANARAAAAGGGENRVNRVHLPGVSRCSITSRVAPPLLVSTTVMRTLAPVLYLELGPVRRVVELWIRRKTAAID